MTGEGGASGAIPRRVLFPGVEVLLRSAVELRERSVGDRTYVFLSLYPDEIEERAEALWWALARRAEDWAALELSDALICSAARGEVCIARGAAATFPLYCRLDSLQLKISTTLPIVSGEPFSRSGLLVAAVGAALHSSYEINALTDTPLANWRRVRRGSVLRLRQGQILEEAAILPDQGPVPSSRESVAREVRLAFDAYAGSQRSVTSSLLELSGGFDSTLAAAIPSRLGMSGVSVVYPYYEFRFERGVQEATAEFLGIPRVELDGTTIFPYAPSTVAPRFDEPAVFVTGIRHVEQVALLARANKAERLYVGEGGDQCFATDLHRKEPLAPGMTTRGPFLGAAARQVQRALQAVQESPWTDRRLGTLVYDARRDVWLRETFGLIVRTPFTDRAIFKSALAWSRWCKVSGMRPHKGILADAASDLLPRAVLQRRGKVAYDGVWMRAYRDQAHRISGTFEQAAETLAHIGISVPWLHRRTAELGAWKHRSDREVIALYGIASWLCAWGLVRPADLTWSE